VNKQLQDLKYYATIEYLSMNLVQKLREMEPIVNDFLAEASAFGSEYDGPNCREELYELTETLKEHR
jgi:hypothetical protein